MIRQQRVWIFDLDNTLYDASRHVFPYLHESMNRYIAQHLELSDQDAAQLRRHYFLRYGATLTGLVRHHGVDPSHFYELTHTPPDIARMLFPIKGLKQVLRRLPGKKVVFSNSPRFFCEQALVLLGLRAHVQAVYTIEDSRYIGKPSRKAFHAMLTDLRTHARRCVMVEDSVPNLRTAKRLGMRTLLVSRGPRRPAFVDRRHHSLRQLLRHG